MSKWRRVALLMVGLSQFLLGALAFGMTDAIRIKGVESRAVDASFRVLEVLAERGSLVEDLSDEAYSAHMVAIKPPIREQIETTLSNSYVFSILLVVMAMPVMMIALWPSRGKKAIEHGA